MEDRKTGEVMDKTVKNKYAPKKTVRIIVMEPKPHGWDHGMKTTARKRKVKHI